MATINDDENFKSLLDETILTINLERARIAHQISTKINSDNDANLNVDIDTISCDRHEEQWMAELTKKIEILLSESLPKLSIGFRQFLLNCFFEYHYDHDQSQFKEILTMNHLDLFVNDLQATRNALDVFRAAWTGNTQLVEVFLDEYPTFKDKPGPWGTTLLYSAARNNQLPVMEYLLDKIHCSVNAQNRQHIQRALRMDTITASDYKVDPSAGSTALHGACYGGHLQIVKELIDHDANYFIRNQAEETPIMNAIRWPHIIKYFQNLLNRGYIEEQLDLPESPITEIDGKRRKDCIWEFLPFSCSETWLPFDISEVEQLHELMTVKDGEQFRTEYQWNITQTTCMVRFLQSGESLAWIRCRGSSIFNFDCFALWQIFYLKHPNGKYNKDDLMPMEILDLSLVDEREPKIQLNTWYNCDASTNDRLDEAMNNRRKHIAFILINGLVKFDLMNFTFINEDQSISGFIRWIPKLVSNNDQSKHRIVPIDDFQASSNINPIPLTTKHCKEVSQSTPNHGTFDSEDDEILVDDNIVTDDKQSENAENSEDENDLSEDPFPLILDTFDDGIEMNVNQYIDDDQANQNSSEQLARAETSTSTEGSEELLQKIAQLEKALQIEGSKVQAQYDTMEQQHSIKHEEAEQTIKAAFDQIERLTIELNPLKQRKETVQKMKQKIQITEYNGIAREVMHDFLLPRFHYFVSHLRATVPDIDGDTLDHILTVGVRKLHGTYQLKIQGFPEHHKAFKVMFKRILTLFNCQTSSIEYYERHSNRILRSISQTLFDVNVRTKSWRKYTEILKRLLREKSVAYKTNFNHYIISKATPLTERAIDDPSMSPSGELRHFYCRKSIDERDGEIKVSSHGRMYPTACHLSNSKSQ